MREIQKIAKDMMEQDNRATESPLFVVESRRTVYGLDSSYSDEWVWLDSDGEIIEEGIAELLDSILKCNGRIPDSYRRVYTHKYWEFVTCCLTENGCEEYLKANGHNLGETRIFVHSAWRNEEMQTVRALVAGQLSRP
ncbi:MAG: hypothetical protein AAF702_45705 [Chloroflexota bacterium]